MNSKTQSESSIRIAEAIAAGKKAPRGEWYFDKGFPTNVVAKGHGSLAHDMYPTYADFVVASANARDDIEAMYNENVKLRAALDEIEGWSDDPYGAKGNNAESLQLGSDSMHNVTYLSGIERCIKHIRKVLGK